MKLHYLSGSVVPSRTANSVHVMKMCQAFSAAGCNVTLFARPGKEHSKDYFEDYGVKPLFTVEMSEVVSVPGLRAIHYAQAVRTRVLKTALPDVFYARHLPSLWAVSDLGRPLIFEAHAPPQTRAKKLAERLLHSRPNFKLLVVITATLREEYLRIFPHLPPEKVIVAPDGADLPSDSDQEPLAWPGREGKPQAGYVGHLYPGRGIDLIVELAGSLPGIDFHIVGGTEEDLRYWRSRVQLSNLFLHGYVPHSKTGAYLRRFDLVLAPYQHRVTVAGGRGDTSRWMSPMKIFEYMAHGKAIIASNLPVLKEVLDDKRNSLLVEPEDVAGWIASVNTLVEYLDLRRELETNARRDIAAKYLWEHRARHIIRNM